MIKDLLIKIKLMKINRFIKELLIMLKNLLNF